MKKVLLSFVFVYLTVAATAQLRLNELYVLPNSNSATPDNREFFELYLDAAQTSPQNTDGYVLLAYFNDLTEKGFYLFDLPAKDVYPNQFFVGASKNPFTFQNTYGSGADFNWNAVVTNSTATKYVYNAGTWSGSPLDLNFNNVFAKAFSGTTDADLTVLLFRKNLSKMEIVDGVIISEAEDRYMVPSYITGLNSLPFKLYTATNPAGEDMTIDFASLTDYELGAVAVADFSNDQGYYFCSAWDRVASSSTLIMTPGTTNTVLQGEPLQAATECAITDDFVYVTVFSGAVSPYPIRASLYADKNKDGKLDINNGDIKRSQLVIRSKSVKYKMKKLSGDNEMILVLDAEAQCYDAIMPFACGENISLPVTFRSFNAVRSGSNVQITWETSSESNNSGFYIQRKQNGKDEWDVATFMGSKAQDGNSNTNLSYSFIEPNTARLVTQYRLVQMDKDGKGHYSEIRSVRGMEQLSKTIVYPNPAKNGIVNILFDDAAGTRNIIVSDMTGRIVQQFKNIGSNSLQIQNLMTGLYNIKILNVQTGQQSVERVLVTR